MKKHYREISIMLCGILICNQLYSESVNSDTGMQKPTTSTIPYTMAMIKESIRQKYPTHNEFLKNQLKVRVGQDLSPREVTYLKNRTPRVRKALKDNFDIEAPLKIGLCFSGGGNRAMLTSLGFLLGAQDIGLFDAAYYMVGLSGSTWTISPFSYLSATQDMSLTEFKDQLVPRLDSITKSVSINLPSVPVLTQYQSSSMQSNFVKRFGYDQYLSSIDAYAAFIGDFTLFSVGEDRLNVTWSSIADKLEQGNIPLPLCSMVSYKETDLQGTQYYWLEAGPFEVGSDQLNSYVPTELFGAEFKKGKPYSGYRGHTPEYPISFYEAVCGSAFTFSINEVLDRNMSYSFTILGQIITLPLKQVMHSNIGESLRFSPATFHNYTFGLKSSPIKQNKKIKLYDAAMSFNFPLPVIMRPARNIDLVFIGDASIDGGSLKLAQEHFNKNEIKFPDMSNVTDIMISTPLTIFNDPRSSNYDKEVVTIAYCPFIKNEEYLKKFDPVVRKKYGFCRTFNFNYTQMQAEKVIELTRYNFLSIKDEIKSVMQALQKQKISQRVFVPNSLFTQDIENLNETIAHILY